MTKHSSLFYDPLIYFLRFILGIIRLLYFIRFFYPIRFIYHIGVQLLRKILSPGSKHYQIIRKIVPQKTNQHVGQIANSSPWIDQIYRFSTIPPLLELFFQKQKSKQSHESYGFYLPLNSLDESALGTTVASLASQSYPHWILLLHFPQVMGSQAQRTVLEVISRYLPVDRYQVVTDHPFSTEAASIIYIAAGDIVRPDCLYWISQQESSDLVSFDIVLLQKDGSYQPWCRPSGNSPELMISNNYLSHAAIKSSTVRGLLDRQELDTGDCISSDYPINYKLIQNRSTSHRHISRILYEENFQGDSEAALICREKTIFKEFSRQGLESVTCNSAEAGGLHVSWKTDGEKVSIIIPSKDKADLISTCIDSIKHHTAYPNYEVLIVDNHSQEPETLAYYQSISQEQNIRIISYDESFNYSKAVNLGASYASGRYLLFLNNDIQIFRDDWLTELVQWAMLPQVGVVGAQLLYPNNTIQHAGVVFDSYRLISHIFYHQPLKVNGPHGSVDWYRNYVGVTGACQMIRKEVFDAVGGYDDQFVLSYSDIIICLRLMEFGYRVVYNPFSILYHCESATRIAINPSMDKKRAYAFFRDSLLSGDPFLSDQIVDSFNPRIRILEPERNKIVPFRLEMKDE